MQPDRPISLRASIREITLFLLVGGAGAAVYVASNAALTWAGLRPSVAILCTLVFLVPATYWAQRRFTFRSDRGHAAALPRYAVTQVLGNATPLIAAELFPAMIRGHPVAAFSGMAVLVATTNYGILKFWAFRKDT